MRATHSWTAGETKNKRALILLRPLCRRFFLLAGGLCLLVMWSGVARAQSYLTSVGQPQSSAPEPVELGYVESANGHLHLEITLGSLPQRGSKQPLQFQMVYDSNIWKITSSGSKWWNFNTFDQNSVGWRGGWRMLPNFYQNVIHDTMFFGTDYCRLHYVDWSWTDLDDTKHIFPLTLTYASDGGCQPSVLSGDALAADSSGYHLYVSNYNSPNYYVKVYAPDGTLVYQEPPVLDSDGNAIYRTDTNGNFVSGTGAMNSGHYVDTLRRTAVQMSSSGTCGINLLCYDSYDVPNSQGGTSHYVVTVATILATTHFGQSQVTEGAGYLQVPQSILLPDNTSIYTFHYDCDQTATGQGEVCDSPHGLNAYYGTLTRVTLPTGGYIGYAYMNFFDSYGNANHWVYGRSNSGGGTWTYYPQVITTCGAGDVNCQQKVTVSDFPRGRTTVTTFKLNNGAWPTQVQTYRGIGAPNPSNLLSTVTTNWDFANNCPFHDEGCVGAGYIRRTSETTTVPGAGGASITKQVQYSYDTPQNGKITAIKEWRFYPGASPSFPSVPDRATYVTYYAPSGGWNIINRPASVTVCNNSGSDGDCPGGGSKVSRTVTGYDSYTNGLTSKTLVAHHDDQNFGVGTTVRGNPTQIQQWLSGSTYLPASQLSYDTTGQVLQATDPKGISTLYDYTDNFFTETGPSSMSPYTPSAATNAYLKSVTRGGLTTTSGYYFGSGQVATSTDPNNATASHYFWDSLDRPTRTGYPVGWDLTSYTSATQIDTYVPVDDPNPSTSCSSCRHNQFSYDGLGRKVTGLLANSPGGAVGVDTSYDSAGRVQTVSHPYGPSDPTKVYETFAYDELDRTVQITHPDGQSSGTAYGPAVGNITQQGSPSVYGYGYPVLGADETGKQKLTWMDGFGRIIEVDEPSGAPATAGHGTVTINGTEQSYTFDPCHEHGGGFCPQTVYDTGWVSITVNGYVATANYGQSSTGASVASDLTSLLNASSSPVTASRSGIVITLTAKVAGSQSNYSLSAASATTYTTYFSWPSFTPAPSGSALIGGTGGVAASPFVTLYTYDAADRLRQVVQGAQTRTYVYDGLGRLTSAQLPEVSNNQSPPQQCPVTFTYDNNGNVTSKTVPAPNQTSCTSTVTTYFCYDNQNRVTGKAYTSQSCPMTSPVATYTYDQGANALGRLSSVADPSGSEAYTYDQGGSITQVNKIIGTNTYTMAYQPSLPGQLQLNQIIYPSGRVVTANIDNIGRLTGVTSGSTNYTNNLAYNAAGQVTGYTYGNGVVANFVYSPDRSQMTSLSYAKSGTPLLSLNYGYKTGQQPNCDSQRTIAGNDGLIQCIQDTTGTPEAGRSATYGYDALNRLTSAVTTGSTNYHQWGLAWTYDRYGNRSAQTVTAGTNVPSNTLTFSAARGARTNRPDEYTHDAPGNMLYDGNNTLTFDNENRLVSNYSQSSGTSTYTYDDNDIRVKKVSGTGTTTVYIFSGSKDIAEYDNGAVPTSPSREYIYAAGRLVATLTPAQGGGTTAIYHHADHLSVRVTTDASGNKIGEQGHYPYGEQWYTWNTTTKFFFTTYERDGESGNDYAMARFYINRFGRFCSMDPVDGNPADPQSWNHYVYARDNPINLTDPSGKIFGFLFDLLMQLFQWIWHGLSNAFSYLGQGLGQTQVGWEPGNFLQAGELTSSSGPTISMTVTGLQGYVPVFGPAIPGGSLAIVGAPAAIAPPPSAPSAPYLNSVKNDLQHQKLNKGPCQKDLNNLGITADQFRNGAAQANIMDGTGFGRNLSTLAVSSPDQIARDSMEQVTGTVGDILKLPGVKATAGLSEHNIYVNPQRMLASDYFGNKTTIAHEIIHNITGKIDPQIQDALGGLPHAASGNITEQLKKDCF